MQIEPSDVVERLLAMPGDRDTDPLGIAAVAGDDPRQHLEAPRFEQRCKIAGGRRTRRVHLARLRRLQFGVGIDKDQRLAALQHELVDREQCLRRQVLRMHQHQHIDIGRDRIEACRQRLDLVELLQLLDHRHRLARPALHHRRHVTFERQAADQADYGLLRKGQAVDELGQIVFEKALALGRKERDDLLIVGGVGRGEAEINLVALAVERHRLQAKGDRLVLDIGKRLGIEDFEAQLAVRCGDILLEQFAHALGIDAVGRDLVAETVGIVKAQGNRLVDLRQGVHGPGREGVEMLGGQIEPGRKETGNDDVGRDQHQRDAHERRYRDRAARAEETGRAGGGLHLIRPFRDRPGWRSRTETR